MIIEKNFINTVLVLASFVFFIYGAMKEDGVSIGKACWFLLMAMWKVVP